MSINLGLSLLEMFFIPKHLKLFACGSLRAILPTSLAKATACQAQKNHSKPLREAKA